jgi:hypothetical protein
MTSILGVSGNIGNVVFLGGNIAVSGQVNVTGNIVSNVFIGNQMALSFGSNATLMNLMSTNVGYTSTMLHLLSTRPANSQLTFIECDVDNGATEIAPFAVWGDGSVITTGSLTVNSSRTTGNNIISTTTAGTTTSNLFHITCATRGNIVFGVDVGGTITANVLQNKNVANLYTPGPAYNSTMLNLQTLRGNSTGFNFINCVANDGADPQFIVDGSGAVKSINTSGSPDVMNVTTLNTAFRGSLIKGYLGAGGYTGQQFITCVNAASGNVFRVRGDGTVYGTGTYNSSGADYAELFEWDDGNPTAEDRRCKTVVLTNSGKIRLSVPSDDPWNVAGVVSTRPSVVGDSYWNQWSEKYIRNKFGDEITLNPEYDANVVYIQREERPEWDPIGLVGKLRVLPDQKVNPSWRFMRSILSGDGEVHEYLLTSGVNSNFISEITSLRSELENIKLHLGI